MGDDDSISNGFFHEVNDPIIVFDSCIQSIVEFKASKTTNDNALNIYHRRIELYKMLQAMASPLPNLLLLGEPGTGKTALSDACLDVLTLKQNLEEITEEFPGAESLFSLLLDKSSFYQGRDYIILPNLRDPRNPIVISYTDPLDQAKDYPLASQFCNQLGEYFNSFVSSNRYHLKRSLNEQDFRLWNESVVVNFLKELYLQINKSDKLKKFNKSEAIFLFDLSINSHLVTEDSKLSAKVKLVYNELPSLLALRSYADIGGSYPNPRLNVIEVGLANKFVPDTLEEKLDEFLAEYLDLDVTRGDKFISEEEKTRLCKEVIKSVSQKIYADLNGKFSEGVIASHHGVLDYLTNDYITPIPTKSVSKRGLNVLLEGVKRIVKIYSQRECSESLQQYFQNIQNYFFSASHMIENSLNSCLVQVDEFEKKKRTHDLLNRRRYHRDKDKEAKESSITDNFYDGINIRFKHGNFERTVKNIMRVGKLEGFQYSPGYTHSIITNHKAFSSAGTFITESEDTPPHLTLTSIADFFKAGIIEVRDGADLLVQNLADDDTGGLDTILQWLNSGKFALKNNGITFLLEKPTIQLWHANYDPFMTMRGDIGQRNQTGLRDRFHTVIFSSFTPDTESERKSVYMIHDELIRNSVNNYYHSKEKVVPFSSEARAHLLSRQIYGPLISISYRNPIKYISALVGSAIINGDKEITMQTIKRLRSQNIPKTLFERIDHSVIGGRSYFSEPFEAVGYANGLGILMDGETGEPRDITRSRVVSYILSGRVDKTNYSIDSHFDTTVIGADAVDVTFHQGYALAVDYMIMLLDDIFGTGKWREDNWVLRSHQENAWQGVAGPSASSTYVVSMLSALSGIKTFNNRFSTGTIMPASGDIERIGGTYGKSLVPWRFKQHSKNFKAWENRPMYFLFPSVNGEDFSRDLETDPFELALSTANLPHNHITQLWYLYTCGPDVKRDYWKNLNDFSEKHFEFTCEEIRKKRRKE